MRDHIHVEAASGAKASRPKLDLVFPLLCEGDRLNVTRLARSALHLVTLGADLRHCGIPLHVIGQGVDTATLEGRAMSGILSVLAGLQRELTGADTKGGLAAARTAAASAGGGARRPPPPPAPPPPPPHPPPPTPHPLHPGGPPPPPRGAGGGGAPPPPPPTRLPSPNRPTTPARRPSNRSPLSSACPRSTVYGHLDKATTILRRPKKTTVKKP
ncbi:recombinase family protein [Streptomyces sp. NPDC050564]|uniref:recombinase family protein n=1 Tax=Streptomyces sp. NPDC050564 TaxID=3365631 RepID=UPI0037A9A994